jgi:hypothetical protein
MSEKILPCPFCNSLAEIQKFSDGWVVFCPHENKDCMVVETIKHTNREDAIKQWNTRVLPSKGQEFKGIPVESREYCPPNMMYLINKDYIKYKSKGRVADNTSFNVDKIFDGKAEKEENDCEKWLREHHPEFCKCGAKIEDHSGGINGVDVCKKCFHDATKHIKFGDANKGGSSSVEKECQHEWSHPATGNGYQVCMKDGCSAERFSPKEGSSAGDIEVLSAEIHKCYCRAYEKRYGKPYWTNGDYSKLDEPTKDYDREMARWHIASLSAKPELVPLGKELIYNFLMKKFSEARMKNLTNLYIHGDAVDYVAKELCFKFGTPKDKNKQ